jgi:hypothetical protein
LPAVQYAPSAPMSWTLLLIRSNGEGHRADFCFGGVAVYTFMGAVSWSHLQRCGLSEKLVDTDLYFSSIADPLDCCLICALEVIVHMYAGCGTGCRESGRKSSRKGCRESSREGETCLESHQLGEQRAYVLCRCHVSMQCHMRTRC